MFHATRNMLPINLQNIFDLNYNTCYNTRNSKNILHKTIRTNLKSHCVTVIGVKLYNSLDSKIKSCTTLKKFINAFKLCKITSYGINY